MLKGRDALVNDYIKEKCNNIYYNIKSYKDIFIICLYYEINHLFEIYYLSDNSFFNRNISFMTEKIKKNMTEYDGDCEISFSGEMRTYDLRDMGSSLRLAKLTGFVSDSLNYTITCDTDDRYSPERYPYIMGYHNWNYGSSMLALYLCEVLRTGTDGQPVFVPAAPALMNQFHEELHSQYFKKNMPERLKYIYIVDSKETRARDTLRINDRYLKPVMNTNASRVRRYQFMTGRHVDIARLNEKKSDASLDRQTGILGYRIHDFNIPMTGQGEHEETGRYCKILECIVSETENLKKLFHDKNYIMTLKLKRQLIMDYPELVYEKKPGSGRENYTPDVGAKNIRYDRMTVNATSARIVSNCLCPYGKLRDADMVSFLYPSRDKAGQLGVPQVNVLDEIYKFIKEEMRPLVRDWQGRDILQKLKEMVDMFRSIEGRNFNDTLASEAEKLDWYSRKINVPYMNQEGRYSGCYVTFSMGGLHGAQYNKEKFEQELHESGQKIELFPKDANGDTSLDKRYAVTSFGNANHEDFISYYTILLCNMEAFKNEGIGYDRYEEIFRSKVELEKLMKDKNLSEGQRNLYSVMRENTKLILTSASGAADVNYNSSIRMNNQIISMRIIGQLFTWRIGQAQALKGAEVISTNTDGLYTVMDEKLNSEILEREAEKVYVGIKPEVVYLVSKDSNNRLEGIYNGYSGNSMNDITVTGAHGGQLNGMNGAITTKSPDHPVIIDWALAEILKWKALNGRMDEFSDEMGMNLIKRIAPCQFPEKREHLRMFQHIISSSPDKKIYNFGTKVPYALNNSNKITPIAIAKCNRVFYVEPEKIPVKCRDQVIYLATAYIRSEMADIEKLALHVIKDLYHDENAIITGTPRIKRINGIEYPVPCMIINDSLDSTDFDPEWLNYEYYNYILGKTYKNNWQNNAEPSGLL